MTSFLMSSRARRIQPEDERGSMAIVLIVVLVGLTLSALLVPMIVTQDRTTRFDNTRFQALNAAQSGIDVMLGLIRAGVTTGIGDDSAHPYGDSSKLPCGPNSGVVNGAETERYSVVVEYFVLDPVTDPYPSDQAMKCITGFGTFDARTGATTPGFARFTSTGTVGAATNGSTAGRTLSATYVFRTSNANVLGGQLKLPPTGSDWFCVDAGSPIASAGTPVVLQRCSESTPPAPQQVFAYRTDLTLQLLSSITAANPNGLCLSSATSAKADDNAVGLVQCGPLGAPTPFSQQWSYNVNGRFEAAGKDSATTGQLSNKCMDVIAQLEYQPVELGTCDSADPWSPSSSVGPGAAAAFQLGDGSSQLANYYGFSRCLNVNMQNRDNQYLIDLPCTQNPFIGALTPEELFLGPLIQAGQATGTGQISNDNANCLTSVGIVGSQVTLTDCKIGGTAQDWTVYGGDSSLDNSTKYTLVNGSLCLGLTAPIADPKAPPIVQMETCNGTAEQKWNAVSNLQNSALQNTHE